MYTPAAAPVRFLRKSLRFGIVFSLGCSGGYDRRQFSGCDIVGCHRPPLQYLLERVLSAEFDQAPAHDLYRVPPLVVLETIPRLFVEDGAVVENVIDVDIRLYFAPLTQREEPAETQIELFDPLPV